MSSYLYDRKHNLIDLTFPHKDRFEVDVSDGTSGSSDDEYGIVINEKASYPDPDDPKRYYDKAAVVTDPNAGSDDSSTIASSLATEVNNVYGDEITASSSGSTVTVEPNDTYDYMDLWVNTFTTDDNGSIQAKNQPPEKYEIQNASNWDGSFTTMETTPPSGFVSSSADEPVSSASAHSEFRGKVRFRFDPNDYSLNDNHVNFFKIAPVVGGVTQSAGPVITILSSQHLYESHPSIILKGDAPKAADVTSALELTLPYQTNSIEAKNTSDPAEDIFLSFGSGASELKLSQGESLKDNKLGTADLKVRTDNGAPSAAQITIYLTILSERLP